MLSKNLKTQQDETMGLSAKTAGDNRSEVHKEDLQKDRH